MNLNGWFAYCIIFYLFFKPYLIFPFYLETPLMDPLAHIMPDDLWVDINELVDEYFKFFINPAYNGKCLFLPD